MEREGLTIQQLAAQSGVNPRTIHYYVARGLVPGAGKQGPRTRYPERVLEMLFEIRRLQTESELTLREIRRRFVEEGKVPARRAKTRASKVPARHIGEEDATASHPRQHANGSRGSEAALAEAPHHAVGMRGGSTSLLDALAGSDVSGDSEPIPTGAAPDRLLAALKTVVGDRTVPSSGSGDRWVAIPITRDLLLAARRLRPEEQRSLQRAADYLRRILLDSKS